MVFNSYWGTAIGTATRTFFELSVASLALHKDNNQLLYLILIIFFVLLKSKLISINFDILKNKNVILIYNTIVLFKKKNWLTFEQRRTLLIAELKSAKQNGGKLCLKKN